MQLTSGVEIPDGLLAAMSQLAENSRQGFEQISGTMHWASGVVISHTSLGISGPLYDEGTESRYTGKERDAESGLDYFGARYYASSMGRWMSPDWSAKEEPVPYAKLDDPQSLNLYSYVGNNPLWRADADGHCFWDACVVETYVTVAALTAATAWAANRAATYLGSPDGQAAMHSVGQAISNVFQSSGGTEQGRDSEGKFLPTQPGQTRPGADSEKQGLDSVGADKNTKPLPGSSRIPDGTGNGTVEGGAKDGQAVEVKSGQSISNTGQLKEMGQASVDATGHPLLVVATHPNPTVSQPAQNNPNLQIVHKPGQQ